MSTYRNKNVTSLYIFGFPSGISSNEDIFMGTVEEVYRPLQNLPWNTYVPQGLPAVPFLLRMLSNGQVYLKATGGSMSNTNYINAVYTFSV
ncbi:hypothetical protein [Clostridium sp. AM58-1XD]|uniref:hypothetical protein n=1 Tax=Clostridium sp. AM58-1XD TaxID=2292307 RepID=UPI0011C0FA5E|nr:hypothetical protein [Clostridium sp. AM58-1XD]